MWIARNTSTTKETLRCSVWVTNFVKRALLHFRAVTTPSSTETVSMTRVTTPVLRVRNQYAWLLAAITPPSLPAGAGPSRPARDDLGHLVRCGGRGGRALERADATD